MGWSERRFREPLLPAMPSRRREPRRADGEAIGVLPIPGEFSVSVECTVVGGGATFSITVRMGSVWPPLISA